MNSQINNLKDQRFLNFVHLHKKRELQEYDYRLFSRRAQVSRSLIDRLGLIKRLEGHCGCVNCIEFNESGNLLLSGSDDFSIILWDVHRRTKLKSLSTGHRGNIFSVKFLPQTDDSILVSGAGDYRIEVREIHSGEVTQVCTCHSERVKRIATVPSTPSIFFSASEDGTVMQFDTRMKHKCSTQPNNVLVNLKQHAGRAAECKCVTVNPLRSELIAIGASDPFVRVYDRRMIKLTTVQYRPGGAAARSSTDRRNYASNQIDASADNLLWGCVQYFVPGHLPSKMKDYYRRDRSLTTTYLSYSSDGAYLLANLGGDHIYLFDTVRAELPQEYTTPPKLNQDQQQSGCLVAPSNGVCKPPDSTNGYSTHFQHEDASMPISSLHSPESLPLRAEALRHQANVAFNAQDYGTALELYNAAINSYDNISSLYSARAATLIKRKWDGDTYAALRDCNTALKLDPSNIKARFRQVRCLHLLGRDQETQQCLEDLQEQYPQLNTSSSWTELQAEITNSTCSHHSGSDSDREEEGGGIVVPPVSSQETFWRSSAKDYDKVYSGHCNTTTDIKEAVFIGENGQFITAGSDDGNLFIWDRYTTNLVRVIEADTSIVNCVQSHPSICLLATSGIESVVKLWGPVGEVEDEPSGSSKSWEKITRENQERMGTDPVEMIILQMGDFVEGGLFGRRRMEAGSFYDPPILQGQNNMQCRPS